MEEYKVTGIVLNSIDYKDNDKLITIFTVELGKITAKLRSVKLNSAKLKFASQPFCFAEFILQKQNDNNFIVTSASLIDSFYDFANDYDMFMNASEILKICNYILKPNIISVELFFNTINCLKLMLYDDESIKKIMVKFFQITLDFLGVAFNIDKCVVCNKGFFQNIYYSFKNQGFICEACSNNSSDILFSKQEIAIIKIMQNTNIARLKTVKVNNDVIDNLYDFYEKLVEYTLEIKL